MLCLVFRVKVGKKEYFCCDPLMLAVNYDCFLFSPKSLECSSLYYQDQIIISRFFGFVRNVIVEVMNEV